MHEGSRVAWCSEVGLPNKLGEAAWSTTVNERNLFTVCREGDERQAGDHVVERSK